MEITEFVADKSKVEARKNKKDSSFDYATIN